MAVFTDLSHPKYARQLSQVEEAYGLTVTSIEGVVGGSADSKFKIKTIENLDPLVLTIHETADISVDGLSSQATGNMLHYVDYLASVSPVTPNRVGKPAAVRFLRPMRARLASKSEAPYLALSFAGIEKVVSIIPFVCGNKYENNPEEIVAAEDAYLAGRALAGYLSIARSYPDPASFEHLDFEKYVLAIARLAEGQQVSRRLGYMLSGGQSDGADAQNIGRAYLAELMVDGLVLLESWHDLNRPDSPFFKTLVHGDFFVDNSLFDEQGQLIMIDFAEVKFGSIGFDIGVALNSWATQNGRPVMANTYRFLEGFDGLIPLTKEAIPLIPTIARLGAFRWETFRIECLAIQDPRHKKTRSPAEFQSLRQAWKEQQGLFDRANAISNLYD